MEPIIEFCDYSFKYRAQEEPTLHDINLKIYPGEKVLIVGPSGSGKSTLAHCINGLVPFSYSGECTGSLKIKGMEPKNESIFALSKVVGTVLQDTDGQFIGLTVGEDIAFALENDMVPHQQMVERVNEVADKLELTHLLDNSPSDLSGGQKQRVSMAGVMVDDVEILLFDEPLANLDPATGKSAIDRIDTICREGDVTVIIIEHRLEDALYRDVDRIVVINDGTIIADDTPANILATDIMSEQGIREPLYIAAIKHAGGSIDASNHPENIERYNIGENKELVTNWFNSVDRDIPVISNEPCLDINNLEFGYISDKPILKGINFSIKKGEMISIVGKNGAGKTTLSSIICGFFKADRGEILLNGKDISPLSIKERGEHIGYCMQNPNQMISQPLIFDEVALGLRARGVKEEEVQGRVYDVLKTCGLYGMRNWPVSALSFGQKKRLSIASILVMNPEILILDEPTAGQDYAHYTEFMEFIKRINDERGITILMITHDMHLMLEYTNRSIVLCDGEIIMDDTPSKVLTSKDIVDKAYLKETSLCELAAKCGILRPYELVDCFIAYERQHMRGGRVNG